MKKILSVAFLFLLALTCHAQKEFLQYNLEKGKTYSLKTTTKMNTIQTIMEQEMTIEMEVVFDISYKVININDSIYEIEAKYEYASAPPVKINDTYNKDELNTLLNPSISKTANTKIDGKDEKPTMNSIFQSITNKPFYITMTKLGEVIKIEGLKEILESIYSANSNMSEAAKVQLSGFLSQLYDENGIKEMFLVFPKYPVGVNDKWTMQINYPALFNMEVETVYELKESKNEWHIIGTAILKSTEKKAIEISGMQVEMNLSGAFIYDLKINKTTGWITESTSQGDVSGELSGSGITIPMAIKMDMKTMGNQ